MCVIRKRLYAHPVLVVKPVCYDVNIEKSTGFPPNTTTHLLQHSYMFRHTYITTIILTNKQSCRERVWAPAKKQIFAPHPSKGGAAKNIYTKSERLSVAEWLGLGLTGFTCTVDTQWYYGEIQTHLRQSGSRSPGPLRGLRVPVFCTGFPLLVGSANKTPFKKVNMRTRYTFICFCEISWITHYLIIFI